jgi:antitoxin HigA-1
MTESHPGTILRKDFLNPFGLTTSALAKALNVPETCIIQVVTGQCALTAEMALRLGRYFGTSGEFWVSMQMTYDLERAREKVGAEIKARIQPRNSAERWW